MDEFISREISLAQLSTGSVFKIGFICNSFLWGFFGCILGLLAFFGYDTVSWSGTYLYGGAGFFLGLLISMIFSIIGTGMLGLGYFLAVWAIRRFGFGKLSYRVHISNIEE